MQGHVGAVDTAPLIASRNWDYVVLQEGTENAALEADRGASMLPALEQLNQMIRQTGAQPVLLATAGWLDGLPAAGLTDFHQLQTAINAGYDMAASRLGAPVAPVGAAWQRALTEGYGERMWGADRLHASPLGTYLAACVFYATLSSSQRMSLTLTK